jgi:hypothetical protein
MKDHGLTGLYEAARELMRSLNRISNTETPPPEPSPFDLIVEEALWDLAEETALASVRLQRRRGASTPILLFPPTDGEREVLHALVKTALDLQASAVEKPTETASAANQQG